MQDIGMPKINRNIPANYNYSRNNEVTKENNSVDNQTDNYALLDRNYSNSISAYSSPQIKSSQEKPISLKDYVNKLLKQGKVENKDFRISRAEKYDNYNLYIYDNLGRESKVLYWCNGNEIENYGGYDKTKYYDSSDKIKTINSYNVQNKLKFSTDTYIYDKKNSYTEDNLNFETNPNDYVDNLKAEGKKFDIETHTYGDNQEYHVYTVNEFDSEDNKTKETLWYNFNSELSFVKRSLFDNNENEIKCINFNNDNTVEIRNYA